MNFDKIARDYDAGYKTPFGAYADEVEKKRNTYVKESESGAWSVEIYISTATFSIFKKDVGED